jgi:hypothetical protein
MQDETDQHEAWTAQLESTGSFLVLRSLEPRSSPASATHSPF